LIRVQGFKRPRIRVKTTKKQIYTEKFLTLGTVFLYRHTLIILEGKGREGASVYVICIKQSKIKICRRQI